MNVFSSRYFLYFCFLLIVYNIFGCSINPPPNIDPQTVSNQIRQARQSIAEAREQRAEESAPEEISKAESLINEAQKMLAKGKTQEAFDTAYIADLEAKIALALSREANIKYHIEKTNEHIKQLLWEIKDNELALAKANQAIAERIAYEAQIGSEVSSELADRKIRKSEIELLISRAELELKLAEYVNAPKYAEQAYKNATNAIKEAKVALSVDDFQKAQDNADDALRNANIAFTQAKIKLEKENEEELKERDRAIIAIAKAEVAIEDARISLAEQYAKDLYEKAENAIKNSRLALSEKKYDNARSLAEQARITASSALAVVQTKKRDENKKEQLEETKAYALDALAKAERTIAEAYNAGAFDLARDSYSKAQALIEQARQYILEKNFEKALSTAQDSIFNSRIAIAEVQVKTEPKTRMEEQINAIMEDAKNISGISVNRRGNDVVISIERDIFTKTGTDIKSEIKPKVKMIAELIKKYPNYLIIIEGHTDNKGTEKTNLQSSLESANNMLNYLINNEGISRDRLASAGYGSSRPIASNADEAGRKQNRRIDIVFLVR